MDVDDKKMLNIRLSLLNTQCNKNVPRIMYYFLIAYMAKI